MLLKKNQESQDIHAIVDETKTVNKAVKIKAPMTTVAANNQHHRTQPTTLAM
jgi:hypothetical protein